MTNQIRLEPLQAARWPRLRTIAALLAALRDIPDGMTNPEGLRKMLATLLDFADLLGLDDQTVARLRDALNNDQLLDVVLAIVRYVVDLLDQRQQTASVRLLRVDEPTVTMDAQSFVDWLPLVLQLVQLITRLRGAA